MHKKLLLYIVAVLVCACSRTAPEPAHIMRLDTAVYHFADLDSASQVAALDSLRPWLDPYLAIMRMPEPDAARIDWLSRSEVVQRFEPDVLEVWPNLDGLERQIGGIMGAASAAGLDLGPCSFATVVWGYSQSIVRADSVVLIALNHYLGADYPGYSHWEAYLREGKTPEALPYNVAEALVATAYPFSPTERPTLLSRMLYEGAVLCAVMRLVPDAKEDAALGYSPQQLDFARQNTLQLWQEMAMAKMIYDSDPVAIDRMIAPAPNSPLMNLQAPGRIGRYIGYEIARKYLKEHPDTQLATLLSPSFYDNVQSLVDSNF